jgi:hypothetical protein
MKTFKEYLTESTKTYDFKVKMACTCEAKDIDKIKEALTKYKVESVSQPKRLPIQESPEFPNCGPVEISIFDVSLNYPANDEQVRQAIVSCGAPASLVRVIPSGHPYNAIMDGKEVSNVDGKKGEAVLLQAEMKAESVSEKDEVLPQHRMNGLIKEVLAARNYEYPTVKQD